MLEPAKMINIAATLVLPWQHRWRVAVVRRVAVAASL
jgi:hypothetical protein